MMRSRRLIALSLILSAVSGAVAVGAALVAAGVIGGGATSSTSFEAQVRSYLLDNPEILIESVQRFQKGRQIAEANEVQDVIAEKADEIFNSPASPATGNLKGDVTVVEFFDYNCPYCRRAAPMLAEAESADDGLRFVFKEWPILGPGSLAAARVALASRVQGKYEALHKALMAHSGSADEAVAIEVARTVGLDVEQLKRDMESPEVDAEIERNLALADELRITGTPTFVIGDQIVRGLVDLPTLQQVIADARTAQTVQGD